MARPLRLEFEGAVYHITSRGNASQAIFVDAKDRELFLAILEQVVTRFSWLCHAYCLMDNHYHLLIETPLGNLSSGMRQLNGVYTQRFNRSHQRVGHLFQGRFKAILIEKEAHLLELSRYIILNPVRVGLVEKPQDWMWSSYRSMIGLSPTPSFLTTDWILSQFGKERAKAKRAYISFVEDKVTYDPWKNLKGQIYLGGTSFLAKIEKILAKEHKREDEKLNEIPRAQRLENKPSLSQLEKNNYPKEQVMFSAYTKHDYRMREIATYFGVHYSTVSRAIRKWEEQKAEQKKEG